MQTRRVKVGSAVPPILDHVILGCNDLDKGIAYLEKLSGCRAASGGSHPGRGTRNALLKIGQQSYLEILAPDPEQSGLSWHKEIASLSEPLLVGWAIKQSKLDAVAANFCKKGIEVIGPVQGLRTRPDGETLRWTLLMRADDRDGILPFFIDWDPASNHPSEDAPGGCHFLELRTTANLIETPPRMPNFKIKQYPEKPVQLRARMAGQLGEFTLTSKPVPSERWVPADFPCR